MKSGHIGVNLVRALKAVLGRERAAIGALITLREPTKPVLTDFVARVRRGLSRPANKSAGLVGNSAAFRQGEPPLAGGECAPAVI